MSPPIMQPEAPPIPTDIHMSATKSYEPKFGSFLAYITMIASLTTLVKASDMEAVANTIATTRGSSNSKQ